MESIWPRILNASAGSKFTSITLTETSGNTPCAAATRMIPSSRLSTASRPDSGRLDAATLPPPSPQNPTSSASRPVSAAGSLAVSAATKRFAIARFASGSPVNRGRRSATRALAR